MWVPRESLKLWSEGGTSLVFRVLLGVSAMVLGLNACGRAEYLPDLPSSADLGSPRGYRLVRTITHFHSPFSHDACDSNGLPGGAVNLECYSHLIAAICRNRVDALFMTDHPDNMASYSMLELLGADSADEILVGPAGPYAKRMNGCANGFHPVVNVGFESTGMMGMGMSKHLDPSQQIRLELYQQATQAVSARLKSETGALIVVPHTESRTLAEIREIEPNAIEIMNLHAIVDPKVKKTSLGSRPFSDIGAFLTYLIDPFGDLVPDLGFLFFLKLYPVYFETWNSLIYSGSHVTGLGGTDSHENIFKQVVSDGERLDSHRRMTRIFSNHVLAASTDIADVKTALSQGRGWLVFEGLGSPVGMDFYANLGSTIVGVGDSASLTGAAAQIHVLLPSLYEGTELKGALPNVYLELKRVTGAGTDEVVASATNQSIHFTTTTAGAYRAHLTIQPRHLTPYLSDFLSLANEIYPWIITNHLYLQ